MNIERTPGESKLQYHKRIIYGKLVDKTLDDADFTELSELVYGKSYASDVARRMFYGSRKTLELIDEIGMSENVQGVATNSEEIDDRIVELRKERQKFFDQRRAYSKLVRDRAREEELNEILKDAIENGYLPQLPKSKNKTYDYSENDVIASLNDLHYGINIDNAWNKYNPDICASMMREYADKIVSIGRRHNSENCYIFNAGDCISGKIHKTIQIANSENVIDQVKGVSELISQLLATLSGYFNKVIYISVPGNHSRLDSKDDSPIDERLDDLIDWYLIARLKDFNNICISTESRIDPTLALFKVRGNVFAGVHGDFNATPDKIFALQQASKNKLGELYGVMSGHLHHNKTGESQGVKTIMGGSFMGVDSYCVSKRIFGRPQQLVCVCDSDGIQCYYNIEFNKN